MWIDSSASTYICRNSRLRIAEHNNNTDDKINLTSLGHERNVCVTIINKERGGET